MEAIGNRNFNYQRYYRRIRANPFLNAGAGHKTLHMNNNKQLLAVIPGVLALAALVLFFRAPVNVDTLIGFMSVTALVGIAALEYRINWKRVFGR
jgi:hypothetical protein